MFMNQQDIIKEYIGRAKEKGWSVSKLCERAGVNRSTVGRNLKGQTSVNFSTLRKLEKALKEE